MGEYIGETPIGDIHQNVSVDVNINCQCVKPIRKKKYNSNIIIIIIISISIIIIALIVSRTTSIIFQTHNSSRNHDIMGTMQMWHFCISIYFSFFSFFLFKT